MTSPSALYGEAYYAAGCGPEPYRRDDRWLGFFNGIAREIVRALAPRSVFDAGCALGMLVESLWDLGVEARGVDVSEYAVANVRPDMAPFCRLGSVTEPLPGRFDLVTCVEVLEHVPSDEADLAIERLCEATDSVLFSSTPTDFAEPTHVNVRPPLAWIRAFARCGFRPDVRFDASFLSPHAILFRRGDGYLGDAVDELFAYHLLLRSALVEREQRIGRLSGEAAQARAEAAQQAAAQVREAEARGDRLQAELARLESAHAAELQARAENASAELERVRAAQAQEYEAVRAAQAQEREALRAAQDREREEARAAQAQAREAFRAASERHECELAESRLRADVAATEAARTRTELAQTVRERLAERELTQALRAELRALRVSLREAGEEGRAAANRIGAAEQYARAQAEGAARARAELAARAAELAAARRAPLDADAYEGLARRHAELEARYRRLLAADTALYESEAQRISRY